MTPRKPLLPERVARASSAGSVRWRMVVAGIAVLGVVGVAVGVLQLQGADGSPEATEEPAAAVASSRVASQGVVQAGTIEVPNVTLMRREDAEVILTAAGLSVTSRSSESTAQAAAAEGAFVASQEPAPGVLVAVGTPVSLTLRPPQARSGPKDASKKASRTRWIVCIDPGHQARGDSSPEPVGPGSDAVKPQVTGGATGVRTGIPEYEIALQISVNLKAELESRGMTVVMTRTTNDVSLSNSERAAIANKAGADLFVRIHGDGSPDESTAGISTLYPAVNRWTGGFAKASGEAAKYIQASTVRSTGGVNRGTKARSDLSGFNWSKVPCVLVECGFLSNPVEDRLLASPHYQDKVATGIADGVAVYLSKRDS